MTDNDLKNVNKFARLMTEKGICLTLLEAIFNVNDAGLTRRLTRLFYRVKQQMRRDWPSVPIDAEIKAIYIDKILKDLENGHGY